MDRTNDLCIWIYMHLFQSMVLSMSSRIGCSIIKHDNYNAKTNHDIAETYDDINHPHNQPHCDDFIYNIR